MIFFKKIIAYLYQLFFSMFFNIKFFQPFFLMSNNSKKLHVFGSGSSAKLTKIIIKKNDSCYSCNHSIRFLENWDYIFIENLTNSNYGLEQIYLLKKKKYKKIIFKNLYPYRKNFTLKNLFQFKSDLFLLNEYQCNSKFIYKEICKYLNGNTILLPQYSSSILTMILIGLKEGFKDIILHGVDFYHEDGKLHETEKLDFPFSEVINYLFSIQSQFDFKLTFAKDHIK
jgi:hypothetical protein